MRFKKVNLSMLEKIGVLLKTFHMRPVQKIEYSFDPYTQCRSVRDVMSHLNSKQVLASSTARTKIDVKSDRSEPSIDVQFSDGHRVIFKTENLTAFEILEKLDKLCKDKDTSMPEADIALTKLSGKPKRQKSK